jgi:iron complex outermembrane receptor protein
MFKLSASSRSRGVDSRVFHREALRATGVASSLLLALSAPTVSAATSAEGAPKAAKALKAVIVTAQKREESVQDVPVAISTLDGAKIREATDATPGDFARLVPNLYGSPTGGRSGRPRWFLRGVGVNTSSLVSPIGVYADEVFLSALDFHTAPSFDLDRVEVLRGPQGTLWGKNTTGGAIHFVSKKPSFDRDGYLKLGFGNYNQKELQGAWGGPISGDSVAGRISFYQESRDGYVKNLYTGDEDTGAFNDNAVRGQLLFLPTENLDILLNLHYRDLDNSGTPGYPIGTRPNGADNFGYIAPTGSRPKIGDPIAVNTDTDGNNNFAGQNLKVNWHVGDYTLTSITAYEKTDGYAFGDREQSPNEVIRTYASSDVNQFSQELRLASPTDRALSWIGGLYYFSDSQSFDNTSATLPSIPQVFGTYFQNTVGHVDTESYAAFGQIAYELSDRLKLSAGLRWTWEQIDIAQNGVDAGARGSTTFTNAGEWWRRSSVRGPLRTVVTQEESNEWDDWTYDFSPSYRLYDNVLTFFRYAHGFRSGGYSAGATAQSSVNTVDPETIDSYEIGVKSEWLDGRLVANATAFYYDWKDMQLNIQGVTSTGLNGSTLFNAALGKGKGAEFEVTYLPLENLRLSANVGLLSARYEDFQSSSGADYSGNRFARAPERTASIEAEYRVPLGSSGSVAFGTDWAYQSRIYYSAVDQVDPFQWQDGYTLGNVRISYRTADERIEIGSYIRNVGDKSYATITVVPANGAYRTTLGSPQTYGGYVNVKF